MHVRRARAVEDHCRLQRPDEVELADEAVDALDNGGVVLSQQIETLLGRDVTELI